jgi:hypothetical protein
MPWPDWQSSFHPSYLFMVQGLLFLFNSHEYSFQLSRRKELNQKQADLPCRAFKKRTAILIIFVCGQYVQQPLRRYTVYIQRLQTRHPRTSWQALSCLGNPLLTPEAMNIHHSF